MSLFLAIAAAGITYLSGPETLLTPDEAEAINIKVSVLDLATEHLYPYPLFLFNMDLKEFNQCSLTDVSIEISNESGHLVFASGISDNSGEYHFQLIGEYLNSASLALICDAGPDTLGQRYIIELGTYVQVP